MSNYEIKKDVFETYVLSNSNKDTYLEVVPERGGIITNFVVNNKPIFYLDRSTLIDKSKNIRGGVPILFPICGPLTDNTYNLEGNKPYTMKQHGFARNNVWKVTDVSTNQGDTISIKQELQDNESTYSQYPFKFKLIMEYILNGTTLSVISTIINKDEKPMPVYAGYHPYFYMENLNDLDIDFQYNTSTAWKGSIVNKQFNYEDDEINIIYKDLKANDFHITDHARKLKINVRFDDIYKYLVLWTLKGKNFICVEPWMAAPDAFNSQKDLVTIEPGKELTAKVIVEVVPIESI